MKSITCPPLNCYVWAMNFQVYSGMSTHSWSLFIAHVVQVIVAAAGAQVPITSVVILRELVFATLNKGSCSLQL